MKKIGGFFGWSLCVRPIVEISAEKDNREGRWNLCECRCQFGL